MKQVFDIVRIPKPLIEEREISTIENSHLLNKANRKKRKVRPIHVSASFTFLAFSMSFVGMFFNARQDLALKAQLASIVSNKGKYLVVFQNDAELRPSGGFIGSYGTIDWDKGIKKIEFGTNVYKIDKSFEEVKYVTPPAPIQKYLGVEKWAFRDSNWALDYRDAAENMAWFYEKETDQAIDGVITVNTEAAIELLQKTGEVKLDKYNLVINAGNFRTIIQEQVEKNYYENSDNKIINEPKAILADLMKVMEQKISNQPKSDMMQFALGQLNKKNLMLYSKNISVEQAINQFNWGGAIRTSNQDYLYISRASLGGGKSSKNVNENISYKIEKNNSSSLFITRTHTGNGVYPDAANSTYYRVAIPKGSIISSVKIDNNELKDTVDLYSEYNRDIVGFLSNVAPGSSQNIQINYILPFKIQDNYSLLIQKQSGAPFETYNINIMGETKFQGELQSDLELK
ncbi:MAG: DUF4012 domain-containing protein [Patescibacteria group bacterium]